MKPLKTIKIPASQWHSSLDHTRSIATKSHILREIRRKFKINNISKFLIFDGCENEILKKQIKSK